MLMLCESPEIALLLKISPLYMDFVYLTPPLSIPLPLNKRKGKEFMRGTPTLFNAL
jgi:hypothetical protein